MSNKLVTTNNFPTLEELVCSSCKVSKSPTEFSLKSSNKNGYRYWCKKCENKSVKNYHKTKKGLIAKIYSSQRTNSKKRKHPMPNYTLHELREWVLNQTNFRELYNEWMESGCNRWLVPSCDRKDDNKPYTLGNLTLVKWIENKNKRHSEIRNGINNKHSKSIIGTHIITGEIIEFFSIAEAGRNGFHRSNIFYCCIGKRNHTGSYKWEYAN